MRKAAAAAVLVFLLAGCSGAKTEVERGMALRSKLLAAEACRFDSAITADYGDKVYRFSMSCQADSEGNVTFAVSEPQSIAGIGGTISDGTGRLTFDDTGLAFPLMADDQITPVSAPWVFLKTLRSGYLTSVGAEGDGLRLSIDDSYADDALHLDIWLNGEDIPTRAEILFGGRKILSLDVTNFEIV